MRRLGFIHDMLDVKVLILFVFSLIFFAIVLIFTKSTGIFSSTTLMYRQFVMASPFTVGL